MYKYTLAIPFLLVLLSQTAQAHSQDNNQNQNSNDQQWTHSHYYVGWMDAQYQAKYDFYSHLPHGQGCPDGHSNQYCNGYLAGYDQYWHRAWNNQLTQSHSFNNAAENNANVKINGNNNKVVINEANGQNSGTDTNSGDNSGSHNTDGGGDNSGSGY